MASAARSDQRRARIDKLAEYERLGVRYCWLVDPDLRSLEVLELGGDGRYIHAVTVARGSVERVPGCDGLVVDVDALSAEAHRVLGQAEPK